MGYFYVKSADFKTLEELGKKRQEEIQKKLDNLEYIQPSKEEMINSAEQQQVSSIDEEVLDDGITKSAKLILDAHLNIEKAIVELKKAFIDQENPQVAESEVKEILDKISRLSTIIKKISDILFEYKSK
jgi:hypothetical protein